MSDIEKPAVPVVRGNDLDRERKSLLVGPHGMIGQPDIG